MYAVATFLIVAVLTTVFTQLATGALIATGLPPEIAAFQARSAFSGAGFTTTEAENVVNHPVRRRIIAATMFAGSLGTPTLVVTVLVGLIAPGPGSTVTRSLVTVAGALAVILVLGNRPMRNLMISVGQRYARRRLVPALADKGEELLTLGDSFVVSAVKLVADPADAPRSIRGLEQVMPQVRVLGVRRDGRYLGESPVDVELHEGDELVVHGRRERLAELMSGGV